MKTVSCEADMVRNNRVLFTIINNYKCICCKIFINGKTVQASTFQEKIAFQIRMRINIELDS